MCGIAGILKLDGSPLPASAGMAVKSMTDAMRARGPDGEGIWQSGPVCLGHRRLSIIDLAGGSQPMQDWDRNLCIVFNGEIYNFKELRAKLAENGAKFRTFSDTEVILAAYAKWGVKCLDYLEGMFAFSLWDSTRNILFCARDHFGKKPFYFTVQDGFFVFASDLNALSEISTWQDARIAFEPAPNAIMRYLAYEYVPAPESIYKNTHALEPAHFLEAKNGETSIRRYWDLPMPLQKAPGSMADLGCELTCLMKKAVSLRMISDVPLGVFLSGGIDSSIVAALMARESSQPIQAFSIGFKEASYDESGYAEIMASHIGARSYLEVLSADECARRLPHIAASMDTPMADASCAPTWLLSRLAREHVTVALGGDGADELWAGYEHYIGYKIALIYNRLSVFARKNLIEPLARLLPASAGYINPRLAVETFFNGAAAPDWLRVQTMLTAMNAHMIGQALNPEWLAAAGPEFLETDKLFAPTKKQFEHWRKAKTATPLARAFHVYCRQFLLDDILVKVDRCSMLHSLEVRVPFLDKHVAEFAARLPIPYKLHGFKRKYLLKKAFADLLPRQILHRNKRGFQIPVSGWLRGMLKPLLLSMADPVFLKSQGIFSPTGIRKIMDAHFSGKADMRKPLWTFLVFQLWWQAHIK